MTTEVPIAPLEDTVRDAARLMDETHVKVLPISEGDRLVGVVTDCDVIRAVANGGAPVVCEDDSFYSWGVASYRITAVLGRRSAAGLERRSPPGAGLKSKRPTRS